MGSNTDPCYIQNCVITNRVIKRLRCNDNIHEIVDEFEIWPDSTTGFHGNRVMMGKTVSPLFSAVFHPFLFILVGNDDMHESSDEFEFRPDWTAEIAALERLKKSP